MEKEKYCRFLKYGRGFLMILAIWGIEFHNKFLNALYKLFFYLCALSIYILAVIHLTALCVYVSENKYGLVLDQLGVTLSVLNGAFKSTLLRNNRDKRIDKRILHFEQSISDDPKSNAIYESYLNFTERIIRIYFGTSVCTVICFYSQPLFSRITVESANGTLISTRKLVSSVWYPIDIIDHFTLAWATEAWLIMATYLQFIISDIYFFSVFICCIAQLKVLQYRLRTITQYSEDKAKKQMIPMNNAQHSSSEECILLYKHIILTMRDIDEILQRFLLFEFMISSLKISMVLINILWRDPDLVIYITNVLYVATLCIELYLYYWNVNEIILESSDGINEAISLSNWYELDNDVKKQLVFILLRAKYPCKLSIGPFFTMSLDALIKVLKTCYYYLSLMSYFNSKD